MVHNGFPVNEVYLSSWKRTQPELKLFLSLSVPFVLEGRVRGGALDKASRQSSFVRISTVL